jgi:hypothetical protein
MDSRVVVKEACRWKVRRTSSRLGKVRLGEWGTTTVGRILTPPPIDHWTYKPNYVSVHPRVWDLDRRQACLAYAVTESKRTAVLSFVTSVVGVRSTL